MLRTYLPGTLSASHFIHGFFGGFLLTCLAASPHFRSTPSFILRCLLVNRRWGGHSIYHLVESNVKIQDEEPWFRDMTLCTVGNDDFQESAGALSGPEGYNCPVPLRAFNIRHLQWMPWIFRASVGCIDPGDCSLLSVEIMKPGWENT